MGEMATGLAHELNQPLAAIVNYTRGCILRIENKLAEPEALKDAMEQVYRQAERAGEIIKRLRGMVGKREPNRDAIDVNKVVQESVVFSEFEARKSEVSISLNLSHEELFVSIDIVQVEQVLLNLIRNGMDAINDVNASIRDIIISTQRLKNNEVQISVADTGIGISDKVLEQLFDPFFSTKPTGMGMGLAISKTIIVNHGGHLWATKNKKMGTTFHVTLPITNEASDG
jgi:C4-dicarboxylate-specific signal transduction histidine kinase